MKNLKRLIDQFNQPDVNLVVSEWPESANKSYHGVAAFAKETLLALAKAKNMRFVILAQAAENNNPQVFCRGKIVVFRVFDHKHPSLYPIILKWLAKFPRIRHVSVHSEFGAYAGLHHYVLLLPFLCLIKLTGRRITYFAHNVLDSINFMTPQLNIINPTLIDLLNVGLKIYNKILGIVSNDIVVLDIRGKETLEKSVPANKLHFLPHWVKPRTTSWSKSKAKKSLGIPEQTKVILSFGFISWYKGSDLLAKLFSQVSKDKAGYQLIFAGGKHPYVDNQPNYQKYYQSFVNFVKKQKNIKLTGFIPEGETGKYFAAADLVLLPYRGLMGGSGALSYAIGYRKPFMVSSAMASIWKNPDFAQALKGVRLHKQQMIFKPTTTGLKLALSTLSQKHVFAKMEKLTEVLCEVRDINTEAKTLYDTLYI